MKISEMTNDQAADTLIRLAVPFGNICDDENTVEMMKQYQGLEEQPILTAIGKMLPEIITHLFKTHKADLYEIIGALTFQTAQAVSGMKFVDTIRVLKDSYDEVLASFFTSYAKRMNGAAGE